MALSANVADNLTDDCPTVGSRSTARILVIDNYDSFVFNLVDYIGGAGGDPIVRRNDALALGEVERLRPDAIVISPGPRPPEDAGNSVSLVQSWSGRIPILGVCLGHQALAAAFGAAIVRAPRPMHGKVSVVEHDGRGAFSGLPSPLNVMRYHSLCARRDSIPDVLQITASTADGVVMGLRHRDWPVEGVQFHPESVLTEHGRQMIRNFMNQCRQPISFRDTSSIQTG